MAARNLLPRCAAFELQIFNESIGIRLMNAVHLSKKFLATIFNAMRYFPPIWKIQWFCLFELFIKTENLLYS